MRRSIAVSCLVAFFAIAPASLLGERPDPRKPVGGNLEVPPQWKVRLDQPAEVTIGSDPETADICFVNMTPGWHVTTGPRAILYHPDSTASGNYHATAEIHLFDPKDRLEGYGVFLGGRDLEAAEHSYDYILLRNDGKFLIKRRRGESTEVVTDWTPSDAIVRYTGPEVSSVMNRLTVEAGPETVRFLVNDQEVAALPRSEVQTDGVFGLRLNHHLNVHVSELGVVARK